jgi:hypothetical protein
MSVVLSQFILNAVQNLGHMKFVVPARLPTCTNLTPRFILRKIWIKNEYDM